jgi:SnoaL-like domain
VRKKLESCDDGAMTDRMAVTDWVARYERAWRSPGTDALDELFTHGVVTPSPWAQPIDGLEAIRRFWDAGRSGPDERFRAQREIVAIDAPVAVVRVAVDYDDGAAVA